MIVATQMDIHPLVYSTVTTTSTTVTTTTTARRRFFPTIQRSASSVYPCSLHRTFCSSRSNSREPKKDGDDSNGEKFSTDWDTAWSKFKKQGKKTLFSHFSPNKYVSWNPRSSNYPLSEEVDPIKRTERSNLMLWTSPRFTLVGAIIIVTFLLVYTILAPVK